MGRYGPANTVITGRMTDLGWEPKLLLVTPGLHTPVYPSDRHRYVARLMVCHVITSGRNQSPE